MIAAGYESTSAHRGLAAASAAFPVADDPPSRASSRAALAR